MELDDVSFKAILLMIPKDIQVGRPNERYVIDSDEHNNYASYRTRTIINNMLNSKYIR